MAPRVKSTVSTSKHTAQSGNTKKDCALEKRSRGWCWTLNNYTEEEFNHLKKVSTLSTVQKCIIGKEVGKIENTPHLQGYFYWTYPKKMKDMKLINERMHLEPQKGSFMDQAIYCTKDQHFYQKGMDKEIQAIQAERNLINNKQAPKRYDAPLECEYDDPIYWINEFDRTQQRIDEEFDEEYWQNILGETQVMED